jgi:two-component system response regulator (stage 0 sporulation protein F)
VKRVLIVDDEPDVVESLAMALENDFEIRTAFDGKAALAIVLAGEPIDVIVLDLMMPVMSGDELIEELRARDIRVPVIVASASRNVEARCAELGVEHCLQKPYRLSRLLEHLHAVSSSKS